MKYSISNNLFKIEVQQKGVELCSIKSIKTGKQYMWNANTDVWGSFSPVLFPIIGCLKGDITEYKGENYAIPKHGFIRHNTNLILKINTDSELVFTLKYNEELLETYPFKFEFEISYKLVDNKIVVAHKVINLDTNNILFSLGGHPAFKCPVNEGENLNDYYLEFEQVENDVVHELSNNGLIQGTTRLMLDNTNVLPLTDSLFDNDALIFKNLKSRKVTLKSKKSKQQLSVSFKDFNYLGIWSKPKANFVCIEPWLGVTDSENSDGVFKNKDGILTLKTGDTFNAEYIIEITE